MTYNDHDFDCTFRMVERPDFNELHDLLQTGWLDIYTPHVSAESVRRFLKQNGAGQHIDLFWETMEVAVVDGKIVGVVNCFEEYVTAFFVAPAFRGRGIGSALMHNAEVRGGRHLEAAAFNTDALRFYETRGWAKAWSFNEDCYGTKLFSFAMQLTKSTAMQTNDQPAIR